MLTLTGFVLVNSDNQLISMELSDDIAAGTYIDDPTPIFASSNDAKIAWQNWAGLFGTPRTAQICEITTSGLLPIEDLEYSEDDEDED